MRVKYKGRGEHSVNQLESMVEGLMNEGIVYESYKHGFQTAENMYKPQVTCTQKALNKAKNLVTHGWQLVVEAIERGVK